MAISIYEGVKLGFIDFWANKLKSLITIIGIVLGTMSIIVILSIINGMRKESLAWMNESGGIKRITIERNWWFENPLNVPGHFTLREFDFIKENIPEVEAINALTRSWGNRISNGQNMTWGHLMGTTPAYEIINEWTVSEGRFLQQIDYRESSDVIVLGSTIKDQLFGYRNPIGQYVTLNGRRLQVIGVMERRFMDRGHLDFGDENPLEYLNRYIIIPLSTMINKLGGNDVIENIAIRALDEKQPFIIKPILENLLLSMRKNQPIFRVDSAAEEFVEENSTGQMFQIIFFFISSISLLVGGIVIMNILLASIKERTREIGIRLTVGARQRDIFLQFLVQSVVITFVGGVIGVISSMGILDFVSDYLKLPVIMDYSMVVTALCTSIIVGLFFGIYPAIKASKLDPVKALRID